MHPCLMLLSDPGLIPGLESIKNGDIARKRSMLKEVRSPYRCLFTDKLRFDMSQDARWMLASVL